MITAIYIGTERLELFEDENIVIKSSVAKIEDITKIFTDVSNDFTVPASDVNNAIFKHWYNADIINGFDARKIVSAIIELGGINFKVGKIKLEKVNLKSNQPYTYSLNFFGNLVELKDTLGDDKLTDLASTLVAYDFSYNSNEVKFLTQGLYGVSFSLLSKRRLLYDSVNPIADTDKQTNIFYNGTDANTGIKANDLTASVKQIIIIGAIEDKYGIIFSRDFFGGYDFSSQFLTLSGTDDSTVIQLPLTNADEGTDPTVNGDVMMAEGFTSDYEKSVTTGIQLGILIGSGYENTIYSFYIKNGDEIVGKKENVTGSFLTSNVLNVSTSSVNSGFNNVTFWLECSEPILFQAEMFRNRIAPGGRYKYNSGQLTPIINYTVAKRLPDIKIIDYLKGIFQMFKLVAIVQKDGIVYVDTLQNYYRNGKVYDFSDYIDYDNHVVSRGELLNEINYTFEDPQTILNQQFVKLNNRGFGELDHKIYEDENANPKKLIDGKKLEFKLPFEQIVYEKILDISNPNTDLNIQYGLLQDENTEFVNIKPHIHYIENKATNIKYVNDDQTVSNLTTVNIPTHVLEHSLQLHSTTFRNEFSVFNGVPMNNNLFTNYHKGYIDRIFNIQKREYNFKAINVPREIVLNLNLNDVIQIKNSYYRIESFETNTTDNNIQLKLINDRNVDLTPLISITMDSTEITMDSTEITMDTL